VLAGGGVVGRAWLEMWLPALLDERPLGEVRVAPATHAGQLLGLVVVSRLASADRFGAADDASLAELGNRLGVVLHNRALDATLQQTLDDLRRTNEELRASRVRLVATADAERRRIERNLHDGAQQHLVALAVNLRLAADEIAQDPTTATDVFAGLGADVREAINELRSLAHGIYPPLLMDAGLVEALRVSAQRSPSPVTVTADRVRRYATETEAAVYFCCMEALQNAAKHAPGATVRVHLTDDGTALRFAVEDDGPGLADAAIQHGHGLGNMVDRVVAVGGTLDVGASASGGTRIDGQVPIVERPAAGGR
jgi:signal transduction histidine kinase